MEDADVNVLPEGLLGLCEAHLNKHIWKQIKCTILLGPFLVNCLTPASYQVFI